MSTATTDTSTLSLHDALPISLATPVTRQESPSHQYSQIPYIVSRWAGLYRIAQLFKQWERIKSAEVRGHVESGLLRSLERSAIRNCAGRRAHTINAVCPRAQHCDVFTGNLLGTVKCKVLVASAGSRIRGNFHSDLAAGNNARFAATAPQCAQALKQIICRPRVIPIIATMVYFHSEAVLCRRRCRRLLGRFIGEYFPPA